MIFLVDGKRIEIRAAYSWFDVYVNYTMILHHISRENADSLINAIIQANGKQISPKTKEV
jgi:hypothetical protein